MLRAKSECRILTNARCLTEGVDLPALDGILFMHPRKSQIEVVQAVGRVMRKAEGKEMGYIILPIVVAPGANAESVLDDNERWRKVWQMLNAIRSHDEGFDAELNRIEMGESAEAPVDRHAVGLAASNRKANQGPGIGRGRRRRAMNRSIPSGETDRRSSQSVRRASRRHNGQDRREMRVAPLLGRVGRRRRQRSQGPISSASPPW